jgi:YD repeat-containing protein
MDQRYPPRSRVLFALVLISGLLACSHKASFAANGSVVYTYDALGRVTTASYDTGVIVIYTYDANGNRTQQVINVNNATAVWGGFNWDAALWG